MNNDVLEGAGTFQLSRAQGAVAGALEVTVDYLGVKATVKIADLAAQATAGTVNITAEQINQAIAAAISNDFELSKVLVAKDGAGHSLMIESLIDGEHTTNGSDLDITFNVRTSPTAAAAATWGANGAGNFYDPSTAFGGGQNHGGFALMAGLESTVDAITAQGTAAAAEVHTLTITNVTTFDVADTLMITVGDEVYYTAAIGTADTTNVAGALNGATTLDGKLFSDKYTAAVTGNTAMTVTYKNVGVQDDVAVKLYNNSSTELEGAGGTNSISKIHLNEGDDVVVLNAAAHDDTIFLEGSAIGNDTIFNFVTDDDAINVKAFMTNTEAGAGFTNAVGSKNYAFVATHAATGTDGEYVKADFDAVVTGAQATNSRGLVFVTAGGTEADTYTVFYVQNGNNNAIDFATEVTILGTVTVAGTTIVNADLVNA